MVHVFLLQIFASLSSIWKHYSGHRGYKNEWQESCLPCSHGHGLLSGENKAYLCQHDNWKKEIFTKKV